jgi:hypothetical protein
LDSNGLIDSIFRLLIRSGHEKKQNTYIFHRKIDDGNSWDVEYDLRSIAQLLLNENHYYYIKAFKEQRFGDFCFHESIKKTISTATTHLKTGNIDLIALCAQNDIQPQFYTKGGSRSNFNAIVKIADGIKPSKWAMG